MIINTLERGFPQQEVNLYKALDSLRQAAFLKLGEIYPLWEYYSGLLPNVHTCRADIEYLNMGQKNSDSWKTPDDVIRYLSKFECDLFSAIRMLYHISKTLPVTTATCERAFSRLDFIKPHNTITSSDRLN